MCVFFHVLSVFFYEHNADRFALYFFLMFDLFSSSSILGFGETFWWNKWNQLILILDKKCILGFSKQHFQELSSVFCKTIFQRVANVDWVIIGPQIRGTNTGFSQGSTGPSCDGNSFFFHNRTRRICTHKDVGVGMEWPFRVYTWTHNSHFFLPSLQPHTSPTALLGVIVAPCQVCRCLPSVQVFK